MSALCLILLLSLATQNQPIPTTQSEQERLMQQMQAALRARIPVLAQAQRAQASGQMPYDPAVCYAIRSYFFERQDGNAPVLVGTSTCTSVDTVRGQRVVHRGKAGFVPM